MNAYINYLSSEIAQLQEQEKLLASSYRKDEANLARIRMNILDICKTVYGVFSQKYAPEVFAINYIAKLDEFERGWKALCEKAEAHDEAGKAAIEQIKLEALLEIRKKFIELGNAEDE